MTAMNQASAESLELIMSVLVEEGYEEDRKVEERQLSTEPHEVRAREAGFRAVIKTLLEEIKLCDPSSAFLELAARNEVFKETYERFIALNEAQASTAH